MSADRIGVADKLGREEPLSVGVGEAMPMSKHDAELAGVDRRLSYQRLCYLAQP